MWTMFLSDDVEDDHVLLITTIAWALWHNQNETRFGGVRKSGQHLSRWASDYLLEYRAAVAQNNPTTPLPPHGVAWSPPRGGHFKINVDGLFFLKQKSVGVGVVIRDEEVRLEAALSKRIHASLGAVEVEAKAFEMGLLFARDIGVCDVVLEEDSLIVYNALCNISSPSSTIDTVVQGIQDICGDFRSVGFSHVRRQGNVPAHLLAKHTSSIDDYVVWIEEDPCCIVQALIHDITSFSHMQ